MSVSIQDRHLIDRYLQGELSGIELVNFRQRLDKDEDFKREVELQELIYKGIQVAQDKRLKSKVISSLNYRKPRVPFALKMIITFLVVTGLGISVWFYIGNESANTDQAKSWLAFIKNKEIETNHAQETPREYIPSRQKVTRRTDSLSTIGHEEPAAIDTALIIQPSETDGKDSALTSGEENIVVKQDQLLISVNYSVEAKSVEQDIIETESLANEAVEKLNPAADLPEEAKISQDYRVEFWVSPINYRGYKMSKNKLVLFGIEEPEAVKLYRVNNTLYMSYHNEYYRLDDSLDFVSYQKLKDSEIPLAIR